MINSSTRMLPMLALRGLILFPGMQLHFDVGRKKSIRSIETALSGNRTIFLAAQKNIRDDDPSKEDIYEIGCIATINQVIKMQGDALRVVVEGVRRGRSVNIVERNGSLFSYVEDVFPENIKITAAKKTALMNKVKGLFNEYIELGPKLAPDVLLEVMAADDAEYLSDYLASNIPFELEDKQLLLDKNNPYDRLQELAGMLTFQKTVLTYEREIGEKVRTNMDDNQRDYYLREQMRVITEELGDNDNPVEEADEYRKKIEAAGLIEETKEKLLKEVTRLSKMPQGSHEATVVRGYLDTCLELPWNVFTQDKTDIEAATKILDKDHYGLDKVKERMLEMIAVRAMAPDVKSQIICLVGPPGVGKTSIARSVASCLERKFARISLGGVHDEADIRGHRRTYVGAMPGRIINAVLQAKSSNPVILMDEIDKISGDYHGDPASALLEALDPEQNNTFTDHFLEIPFDLSNVLFILTANDYTTIPAALYDRMEIINVDSYTREEKFHIAKKHLLKKQMTRHGLTRKLFTMTDKALYEIIDGYTREAGVRELERKIATVCRKSDKKLVEGNIEKIKVEPSNLEEFLGVKKYKEDKPHDSMVGLINGLAWTSVGGEVMQIEAASMPGTGKLSLTGSLGDVMKESAQSAFGYIRTKTELLNVSRDFYKDSDVHVNATEGAVPKDGPSAGVAMTVAIISALTGTPIRGDIAITGEVTLLGRVLPIGGLREKSMAAYKYGVKRVFIPEANLPDLAEVDNVVKKAIEFVPVTSVDQVLKEVFVNDNYLRKENIAGKKIKSYKTSAKNKGEGNIIAN